MRSKKAALFSACMIMAGLLFSSCTTLEVGKEIPLSSEARTSLVVIDSGGSALPIVYPFASASNGVKYYLYDGLTMTREEIESSVEPQGRSVGEVGEIWGTSISDVFALFTPEQLSGRHLHRSATNAALIYDMWTSLTQGPAEIRENPRAMLEGSIPELDMRAQVFDFLEQQRRQASPGY